MPRKVRSNVPKKAAALLPRQEKRHTLKTQIVVNKASRKVICTAQEKGRRHDFRLLKRSKVKLHPKTKALVDTGCLGLQKIHAETVMPKKRSKHNPLTKHDKVMNREISSQRAPVENVLAHLKRFKIIADRYRNRQKRFALRFNLITAIYNMEVKI